MFAPIITQPSFYAFAIPAVIFLGIAKGGFSAASIAATPLLAIYLPPLEAAALLLPILICQDIISVHAYWRQWSAWNLKVLLPGAALGVSLGWLLASHISDDAIRLLVGITALVFVGNASLGGTRQEAKKRTALGGLFWGTVSGLASFASQGGAPPFQVYTLQLLLPIAVAANFAGIWLVKNVPTGQFYLITYALLLILGSVLAWQGASHILLA